MTCWLGIDHGTRRIGLAVGHTESGIAAPLAVIAAEPFDHAIHAIRRAASDHHADALVVGLPLNMDDTEGPQARLARAAGERIACALGLPVRFADERLSSFAADAALAGKYTRKQRKARQDAVAAADMLQTFLDTDPAPPE